MVQHRQIAQALFAKQRQMDAEGQCAKPGIGADVRRGLFPADMLFPGRKRQNEAAPALCIHRLAAQAARHLTHIFLSRREEPEIRSAELEADAQRLPLANDHVRAHQARSLHRAQCHRLRHHRDQQRANLMHLVRKRRQVIDPAKNIGILHDNAAYILVERRDQCRCITRRIECRRLIDQLVAGELRHGARDAHIMGMEAGGEQRLLPLGHAPRHSNRLPTGGRAVIHAGIGDIAAEQTGNLRLELEQHL